MKKIKESFSKELVGDKVISFQEREKRSVEIANRIAEAYPMVGGTSEDNLWRSLNQLSNRDLFVLTQKRMQDIAYYLFDSNPLAKRIIEITRDFVVGDGFTYTADDKDVLEVIQDFWNDPDNNLDTEIDINTLELSIFGELCLPIWVNSANGAVKLGYVDPSTILKVTKDRINPKINRKLYWKPRNSDNERELDIINVERDAKSGSYAKLTGDCFFFTVNKVSSATRGRSDLLSLADWLDGHDQFLFARLERAFLLNTFIWDVTCDGMTKEELTAFVKDLSMPKSGSIRAHNEKVHWKSETPSLEAADASQEARLFKNQILGGAGFPEHWFGEGSTTTRATALEMGIPTLKKLKSRQKAVKNQLQYMVNFVIDQAILHKRLKENVDRTFKIIPSPIISRDNKGLTDSISNFVDGLQKAVGAKWLTDPQAKRIFNTVLSQLGNDIESQDQEEPDDNETNYPPAPEPKVAPVAPIVQVTPEKTVKKEPIVKKSILSKK